MQPGQGQMATASARLTTGEDLKLEILLRQSSSVLIADLKKKADIRGEPAIPVICGQSHTVAKRFTTEIGRSSDEAQQISIRHVIIMMRLGAHFSAMIPRR